MKQINTSNIVIDGDIFIQPDSSRNIRLQFVGNTFDGDKFRFEMEQLHSLNGVPYDHDTATVFSPMLVSESFKSIDECYSLYDIRVRDEEGRPCSLRFNPVYLPTSFFDGKKEGDTVTFKIPAYLIVSKDGKESSLRVGAKEPDIRIVTMKLRLAQKDYRYNMYGTFEEVIEKIKTYRC